MAWSTRAASARRALIFAAAAARIKQIHIGHAVVLSPPGYNPPARVAERIATLDLISSGRVEWGTGLSASRIEIEGFNVEHATRREQWAEAWDAFDIRFKLMAAQTLPMTDFLNWADQASLLTLIHARYFDQVKWNAWLESVCQELIQKKAISCTEGVLHNH